MVDASQAKEYLSVCERKHQFELKNGEALKNLHQLSFKLEIIEKEVFLYHSNEQGCDFSNWIWEVVGDKKLAVELYIRRGDKPAFQSKLNDRISELEEAVRDLS